MGEVQTPPTYQNENPNANQNAPMNAQPQFGQNMGEVQTPPTYQNENPYANQNAPMNAQPQFGQNMGEVQTPPTYQNENPYANQNAPMNAQPQFGQGAWGQQNNSQYMNTAPVKKKSGCAGCLVFLLIPIFIFIVAVIVIMLLPEDEILSSNNDDYDINIDTDWDTDNNNGNHGEDLELEGIRDYHTVIKGDGTDVSTVMVYLLGSDLESDGGFASSDIDEMLLSDFGDNVNVVIMTGGAYEWYNNQISSDTCQYWQVKNGELVSINSDLGQLNMTAPETLTNFINDMSTMFPADRYNLIMWDHGGGTLSGFGYDENYPDTTLTLASLDDAFKNSNVKFDFVGFDACLMATAETALMLEPYADYLIASQELEPGSGWYYTNWLTYLSENPSSNTVDIGVQIIDDFVQACEDESYNPNATLSIVELRQMPYLYTVLTDYLENSTADIINNEYKKISIARNDAKDFGEGDCDQIDMVDYINKAGVDGGGLVIDAVNNAVKYYNNSDDVIDAYGLAMYFPHEYISYYTDMQDILHYVGYTTDYTEFFNVFISAMSGGQMKYHEDTGTEIVEDYSEQDWYDADTATYYEESIEGEFLGELAIEEKDGGYILSLTDEDWEEISKIELQVLIDDGEGYIDLGSDNVYETDEEGNLLIEFDYTWVTLDGHTVPFYAEEEVYYNDGDWYTYGRVPAYLNNEYVEIVVGWDSLNPQGYVEGYRKYSEIGEPVGKGLFPLEEGDVVEWAIDYYTYDWEYDSIYLFGDTFIVPSGEITVSYDNIGDPDALVYFKITDIYNNLYETEAVVYYD